MRRKGWPDFTSMRLPKNVTSESPPLPPSRFNSSGGRTQENIENFGSNTPPASPGQPAEIASVYVELACAGASYVTGQVYGATGGRGGP